MSATGKADERGFTLIEMLVVLAVLGLVSGIAFPAVERAIAQQQFRLAAGAVEASLHESRAAAIARASRLPFEPQQSAGAFALEMPRGGLAFYSDGSSSGGTVILSGGSRRARFIIEPATGQIRRVG